MAEFPRPIRVVSAALSFFLRVPLIRRVAGALNFSFPKDREFCLNVHGRKMYAHTLDRAIALVLWKTALLEGPETEFLKNTIKKGMVVVDVGANIGYYTLQLADWVGPTGKVYAFEPAPDNFSMLTKNIRAGWYGHVVAVQAAVADRPGQGRLRLCGYHRGDHRLSARAAGRGDIPVDIVALDSFLAQESKVDVIKLDIQGGELAALAGMKKLFERNPQAVLLSELAPALLKEFGVTAKQYVDKLLELGLSLYILDQRNGRMQAMSGDRVVRFAAEHPTSELSLVCRIDS